MLRHPFAGLWLGAFLLALSGCGYPTTAPNGEGAAAIDATSAALAPSAEAEQQRTEAYPTGNSSIATTPTAGQAPLEQPSSLPTPPSTSTPISPTPQATPTGTPEQLWGVIAGLDSKGLTLDVSPEHIYITGATQVLMMNKPLPVTSLTVGRSVVVQVARDAQGRLVAERITIMPNMVP